MNELFILSYTFFVFLLFSLRLWVFVRRAQQCGTRPRMRLPDRRRLGRKGKMRRRCGGRRWRGFPRTSERAGESSRTSSATRKRSTSVTSNRRSSCFFWKGSLTPSTMIPRDSSTAWEADSTRNFLFSSITTLSFFPPSRSLVTTMQSSVTTTLIRFPLFSFALSVSVSKNYGNAGVCAPLRI